MKILSKIRKKIKSLENTSRDISWVRGNNKITQDKGGEEEWQAEVIDF